MKLEEWAACSAMELLAIETDADTDSLAVLNRWADAHEASCIYQLGRGYGLEVVKATEQATGIMQVTANDLDTGTTFHRSCVLRQTEAVSKRRSRVILVAGACVM